MFHTFYFQALFLILLQVFGFIHQVNSQSNLGTISSDLETYCKNNPRRTVDLMLDLPAIPNINPSTGGDFVANLKASLISSTQAAQNNLKSSLTTLDPTFQITPYWIVNRIGVKNVMCSRLPAIARLSSPGGFSIRREERPTLNFIGTPRVFPNRESTSTQAVAVGSGNQWGVEKINAPRVWPTTRGAGVVVANIDSGVRGTHEALINNHRGNFGWLDGYTNSSAGGPQDGNGHGTHTMGTIAGKLGIGVAPDATWIACKGCNGGCAESALLTCGQWVFCPYTKTGGGAETQDCSARPKIVSNSWGGIVNSNFYEGVVDKWRQIGIIPIFSIGNDGPACGTTGYPGNGNKIIAVGATDKNDGLAEFSSRGPAPAGRGSNSVRRLKPDVSAPGVDILSSWNESDNSYATLQGTSMATPHVAGAAALLVAKNPNLSYDQLISALEDTTVKPNSNALERQACKTAIPDWPNNRYGYGRINVLDAFNSL